MCASILDCGEVPGWWLHVAEQPSGVALPVRSDRPTVYQLRASSIWRLLPMVVVVLIIVIGPRILPSPTAQSLADRLHPPFGFGGDWLGTDGLGRDLLARVVVGARTSLEISIIAATGAAVVGVTLGVLAGLHGGIMNAVVTQLVQTILAVPFVTVGLMITATIGQSTGSMILLLIATGWITHAHVLRTQARMLAHTEFVVASTAMGATTRHVGWVHVLPNLMPTTIVLYFQQIGSMLLWSASLTWLGIGMPVQQITLGSIVRDGQELLYNGWWVSVAAGLAIIAMVTSLNLFADWLRLSLDPVTKGHRPV